MIEDNKKKAPITDEDIRKALDCCITKDCDKCPFNIFMCGDRYALIWAQDLINRQDADIERLNKLVIEKHNKNNEMHKYLQYMKAEVIKEFARKLLALIGFVEISNLDLRRHINSLAKEMAGDTE